MYEHATGVPNHCLLFPRDVTQLASMCKLKCGRLNREVSDSCLQFWGGMGFTNDVLVSRMYRLVVMGGCWLSRVCAMQGHEAHVHCWRGRRGDAGHHL